MSVPPAPRRAASPGRATSPLQSQVVDHALATCSCVVSVCEAQRQLYKPTNGQVVFVGVPQPAPAWRAGAPPRSSPRQLTLLCLGIVCPRKNQLMAAEVFKEWAGSRKDVRLLIVGARYIRKYELEYVEKVKAVVGNDTRIEVHDVTSDVDAFYRQSDLLLFCSLNEVTPMVIAESMMRSIPVLTTNIAGIPGATGMRVVPINSIEPTAHHVDHSPVHVAHNVLTRPSTWHTTSSLARPRGRDAHPPRARLRPPARKGRVHRGPQRDWRARRDLAPAAHAGEKLRSTHLRAGVRCACACALKHVWTRQMGAAAKKHAMETFTNEAMVSKYRGLGMQVPLSYSFVTPPSSLRVTHFLTSCSELLMPTISGVATRDPA